METIYCNPGVDSKDIMGWKSCDLGITLREKVKIHVYFSLVTVTGWHVTWKAWSRLQAVLSCKNATQLAKYTWHGSYYSYLWGERSGQTIHRSRNLTKKSFEHQHPWRPQCWQSSYHWCRGESPPSPRPCPHLGELELKRKMSRVWVLRIHRAVLSRIICTVWLFE